MDLNMQEVIFASLLKDDAGVTDRKQHLINMLGGANIFSDEYFVLCSVLKEFPRVTPDRDFLKVFLQTNRGLFSKHKNIDLSKFKLSDADPYTEFCTSVLAIFDDCKRKEVTPEDYYRTVEMFRMEYISVESVKILEDSALIVSEGLTEGRRTYAGYEDMRNYSKNKFIRLDNLLNKTERKGTVVYGFNDEEEEESGKVQLVCTYGIEALDKALHGIYEGDMISLLAPAKGGKSRFATFLLHNAVVNGVPIVMWSIENGYKGWEALIRARHFMHFYENKSSDGEVKRFIDADMIRKGELPPDLAEMELASWMDLKANTHYGRIANIDEDFDADTFLEVLDNAVNLVGAKLVCVDYLQLITAGKGQNAASKNDRISEAYKKMLQYLKSKKIAGVFPAQLKQTVVGSLNKVNGEDLINTELRDSAGESYEVIKTPDVNLSLYATMEDLRQGSIKLLSIPSRNSAPFEPIDLACDLGTCTFTSVEYNS